MQRNVDMGRLIALGTVLSISFGVTAGCSDDDNIDGSGGNGGEGVGGVPIIDDGVGGIPGTGGTDTGGTGGTDTGGTGGVATGGTDMGGMGGMTMGGMGGMGPIDHPDVETAVFYIDTMTVEDALDTTTAFDFNSDAEGWTFAAGSSAMTSWGADFGEASGGGIKVDIPFVGYNETSLVQHTYVGNQDWSEMTAVKVLVNWESGFTTDPTNPGCARVVVKTGDAFAYGYGSCVDLDTMDTWTELSMDLASGAKPVGWDASEVRAVGVEFLTGTAPD